MEKSHVLMSERERIIEAVTAMFVKTDRQDWVGVRACFAETVLFDMSSLGGDPPAETPADTIVSGWQKGLKPLRAIHHQVGNFQVAVFGNYADLTCYGIAYHYLPNQSNRNTRVYVGSYEIHLARIDNGWKIDALRYVSKFIDGNQDLEHS